MTQTKVGRVLHVDIVIRHVRQGDIPFLWEMLYQSLYVRPGDKPHPRQILQESFISKYVANWGRSGDIGLVAESQTHEQLGAAWLRLFDEEHQGFGYVDDTTPELGIAIVRDYRGQGMGSALMKEIEFRARSSGYRNLSLSVDPSNPALRLYQRFGYEHVGWCDTSWTMVKKL